MPQHALPRQPLSCENCRKRKIKCSGSRIPCETCVKRGHSQSCFYKRLVDIHSPSSPTATESELLHRIRNLEDMLRQHVNRPSSSPSDSTPSSSPTCLNVSSGNKSHQEMANGGHQREEQQVGIVVTTMTGYQSFRPRGRILDSGLLQEMIESTPSSSSPLSSTNFPFSSDLTSGKAALLDLLPPLQHCDELKNGFFQVFSPLFHVLHDPTFDTAYFEFRHDPSSTSLAWLGLLFVVLAVAITALDEGHPLLRDLGRESSAVANMKSLSAKYRSAAMQCLSTDNFLHQHNLHSVQALVLLIYAMNHANIPSWALLGTTLSIAVAIGCHIDPAKLGLGIIECEERRRVWAALMMLHTIQSTCLGNTAPQLVANTVRLPIDRDDEDLFADGALQDLPSTPTKMSYILYKFRLYKIAAEICQCSLRQTPISEQKVSDLDMKLSTEEREHTVRFSSQTLPVYHIVHHYILKSYLNHLYLLLHRPRLNIPNEASRSQPVRNSDNRTSQHRCQSSALSILNVHAHLSKSVQYRPYRWYVYGLGSFHAFLATSTLIVLSCTAHFSEDELLAIHSSIDQSLRRFEAMANRSEVCARASVILRRALQATAGGCNPSPAEDQVDIDLDGTAILNLANTSTAGEQFPLSPSSLSEQQFPFGRCDWTANPQLEALFFDMAPEQWMAPSTFMWDRWANMSCT